MPSQAKAVLRELECIFGAMLGCRNGKFVEDDDEKYQLHKCAYHLFQAMAIEDPIAHLILSSLDAHHRQFCCGTKTLLVLTLRLIQAADELMAQGTPIDDIIDGYHKGFETCIEYLENLKLDVISNNIQEKNGLKKRQIPAVAEDEFDDVSWYFEDGIENDILSLQEIKLPAPDMNIHPLIAFDSILDDFVTKEHSDTNINNGYSSLKNSSLSDFDEFDDCFGFDDDDTKTSASDGFDSISHSRMDKNPVNEMEMKIKKILALKPYDDSSAKTLNRSRHFRTINSALEEHSNKAKLVSLQSEPTAEISFPDTSNISSVKAMQTTPNHGKIKSGRLNEFQESYIALPKNNTNMSKLTAAPNTVCQKKIEFSMTVFLETFLSQKFKEDHHVGEIRARKREDDFYSKVICGICHNEDDIVRLVQDLFHMQNDGPSHKIQFKKDFVHYCQVSQLSPKWSCIVQGLVVKTTQDQVDLVKSRLGNLLKTGLINGDLTPNFRHKGHKDTLQGGHHTLKVSTESPLQRWIDKTLKLLEMNGVTAVLVRGHVQPDLALQCYAKNINMISNVPVQMLQILAEEFSSDLLVYLDDIAVSNVMTMVTMCPWHPDGIDINNGEHFLVMQLKDSHFQTAVLCSWNQNVSNTFEESLQHAIHRLHNVINDGLCLPGSGVTELLCSQYILHLAEKEKSNFYLGRIFETFASVFERHFHAIHANNGLNIHNLDDLTRLSEYEECIYLDDYKSKWAAWNDSLHLIKQILYIDSDIITGKDTFTSCL